MLHKRIGENMVDACRKMWQKGWVASNDGNISARLPDGTFLTTPTGISKGDITLDMLVLIDAEQNILNANQNYKPSSEVKLHLRCYIERDDIGAVVHAHPPAATAFAVCGKGLCDYSLMEAAVTFGNVPVAPYATPSTDELPKAVAKLLHNHDAVLLSHHGAMTVGENVINAYQRMETLELYAQIQLNAAILGGAKQIPENELQKLFSLRENTYHTFGRHPGYEKFSE